MSRADSDEAIALVAMLPRPQAEVIALRTIGGFDTATTAQIIGTSRGRVRRLAAEGLSSLAALVGDVRSKG
ncbi:MAG TPA: sigma factor-like helix-turn-helix DNA-binding protein [Mycobacteriales bacterium]|nr:sigma factor-like helix-turn-helix DNA-binding protein [Mycobacteriales bacterium]